jgi:6-phosphofructokinase
MILMEETVMGRSCGWILLCWDGLESSSNCLCVKEDLISAVRIIFLAIPVYNALKCNV